MKREIGYTSPRRIALGFLIWAVISGVLIYFSGTSFYENYRFIHYGAHIKGIVEGKRFYASGGGRGGSGQYCIAFTYKNEIFHPLFLQVVPFATYQDLKRGDSIPVIYLPENPLKARIGLPGADWFIRTNNYSLYFMTSVVVLPGVIILWRVISANLIWQRLKREGLMTKGVVKEICVDNVGRPKTPRWFLTLEYRDHAGSIFQGKSQYLTNEQLMVWRPSTQIDVCYDRNRPQLFIIDFNSGGNGESAAGFTV